MRPDIESLATDLPALLTRLEFALAERYAHGVVVISTDTAKALLHRLATESAAQALPNGGAS
jgi:hypothetical protein